MKLYKVNDAECTSDEDAVLVLEASSVEELKLAGWKLLREDGIDDAVWVGSSLNSTWQELVAHNKSHYYIRP